MCLWPLLHEKVNKEAMTVKSHHALKNRIGRRIVRVAHLAQNVQPIRGRCADVADALITLTVFCTASSTR